MNHSRLDCDNVTDVSHICLDPALSNMQSQQSLNTPWKQINLFQTETHFTELGGMGL